MDKLATIHHKICQALPLEDRFGLILHRFSRVASLRDLKQSMGPMLNKELHKEFSKAGLDTTGIDFFNIIDKAVRTRYSTNDPTYDDMFQEVSMNMLDRRGELQKKWIPEALKLQNAGKLTNLTGFLFRVAANLVKDISRQEVKKNKMEIYLPDEDEKSESYIDPFSRKDLGGYEDQSSVYSAKELYKLLVKNLKWSKSKEILDILIDRGITGFLSPRAKGVTIVAETLGVTPATVTQHYIPSFKKDVRQALKRLGNDEIAADAARLLAASVKKPLLKLCTYIEDLID